MFLRFVLVVSLVGAVTKGETTNTTTVGNVTSTPSNYTTPYMTTTSSNDSLVSTIPVNTTTPQVSTTVTPVSPVKTTTNTTVISTVSATRSSTNPPSALTTATATSAAGTNHPTSSETTATTTTPATTQNTITSSPVTSATMNTLTTNDTITNATSTSINSTTNLRPTMGSTITSDQMTTNASVIPTSGSANTSPQVTPTDSTTTVNPPPSINTITTPVTNTDNPFTEVTDTTPIIITTPESMQTSDGTTATSHSTTTNASETTASTATPPSNVTTTTGQPPSSPSFISTSSFLPPITSPGSSIAPLTGNTTSFIPTAPTPGVTINITIPDSTTASPSDTTLMSNVTAVAATTLQPTSTTTIIFSTAAPSTLSPVIVCPSVPCPAQSVCLNGTCQCLSGSYMQNKRCVPAQVFPGRLLLKLLTFKNEMSNRSSSIFQSTAAQISAALRDVLYNEPGYKQSDVVELQPGSVIATVNNIFEGTSATQDSVDLIIKQALSNSTGFLSNSSYTGTNLCEMEPLPCDVSTTLCTNTKGQSVCSCKEGYISIIYSNNSCKACPSGQWAVGDSCQPCSFGYAGFNCDDSALLAVVVVSCVLGGLLLILIVALLCYCCGRRGLGRHPMYTTSPYSDDLNKTWPIGITPIPRATNNWDAAASIEMTETDTSKVAEEKKPQTNGLGSQLKPTGWKKTGSYDLNPDEMQTFKGKYTSRYSYLVQGHENPYFLPGDEKKD